MQIDKNDKICFFNSMKAWGGGEKWHFEVGCRLHEMGYNIIFIVNTKSVLSLKLKDTGIKTITCSIGNLSFLNVLKLMFLKKTFKAEKIEVLVINLSADLKVSGIAAKWAGVKKIIYRRGSAIPVKNTMFNRWLFSRVITNVIANSQATKNTVLQNNASLISPDKIHIIYNGLKIEDYIKKQYKNFYIRKGNEVVIGHAGRMVYQKGYDYLIEIIHKLKLENLNFKLLIAGSGPLEPTIKEKAENLDLLDHIVFLGFVEDIASFMNSIDILALTSRWEGFGFVLAEAMIFKKPIVTFNISSNPELVQHGKNGFLISPFNIANFAEKLGILIRDNNKQRAFGLQGYEMVREKFTFDKTVENFLTLIHREQEIKKRICFFNSNKEWGGGEKWHLETASHLKEIGLDVSIFAHPKSELYRLAVQREIATVKVKVNNISFLNPLKIAYYARKFRWFNPDLLILNLSSDIKTGGIAARLAGVKKIVYRRGMALVVKRSLLNRFIFKRILTKIIVNSEDIKDKIVKNHPYLEKQGKINVIYNGIDVTKISIKEETIKPKEAKVIFGNVGRMVKQKAQHYLLMLAIELKSKKVPFEIHIAGTGALENNLKNMVKKYKLEDCVKLPGFVQDMDDFYNSIDIFILTSLHEGTSNALLEAMACGKPVLAFNISSMPEMVQDGKNGFLVETGNINQLVKKAELLVSNMDLRNMMGQQSLQIVKQKFDTNTNTEKLLQVCEI